MKYRKKPVVIEAIQYLGNRNRFEVAEFFKGETFDIEFLDNSVRINTLEGTMTADPLDWIIKGVKGEFYPCKPDIFEATYEPAE